MVTPLQSCHCNSVIATMSVQWCHCNDVIAMTPMGGGSSRHMIASLYINNEQRECVLIVITMGVSFSRDIIPCVLQCVAVCCSVLQCVAVCCSVLVSRETLFHDFLSLSLFLSPSLPPHPLSLSDGVSRHPLHTRNHDTHSLYLSLYLFPSLFCPPSHPPSLPPSISLRWSLSTPSTYQQ